MAVVADLPRTDNFKAVEASLKENTVIQEWYGQIASPETN